MHDYKDVWQALQRAADVPCACENLIVRSHYTASDINEMMKEYGFEGEAYMPTSDSVAVQFANGSWVSIVYVWEDL